jgi:CBS domain-containing protein
LDREKARAELEQAIEERGSKKSWGLRDALVCLGEVLVHPIGENDRLIGMVIDRDIVWVRDMEKLKVRRLPVIKKSKRMIGMLSLGDVSHSAPVELLSECVKSVAAHHH